MNQPDRLRREAGRQRVEEFLNIHGCQLADLTGSKFRKQIGLEVLFVLLTCGVLQMRPRQFLALVVDGPHCFLVAREKVGLVVTLIDSLHELVAEFLCLALTWHLALRPGLRSSLTRGLVVIPVEKFPLGPKILHLSPLITLLHHGPPYVVLQTRSLCSIKGGHRRTSDPAKNWWITAGRNRTYRPRRSRPGNSSALA